MVDCTFDGDFPVGRSETVPLVFEIGENEVFGLPGTLGLTGSIAANAKGDQVEFQEANNSAVSDSFQVLPPVSLELDDSTVTLRDDGDTVSYNVQVRNRSGNDALGVVLTLPLPASVDPSTVDLDSGCSITDTTPAIVTCVLPRVTASNPARLNIRMPTGSCLLYTSPSPRDATLSRMPSSA